MIKDEKDYERFKQDNCFMFKHNLKELSFYCANDSCYEATFVRETGETFTFKCSRAKVMEHIERTCAHPERYLTNKGLVVAHFHNMAKAWYAFSHQE